MKQSQTRDIKRQARRLKEKIGDDYRLHANPRLGVVFVDLYDRVPFSSLPSKRSVAVVDTQRREALVERGDHTHGLESALRQLGYDVVRRQEVQA